jgi:parvulin-like peptidyl-prolyl isomerase
MKKIFTAVIAGLISLVAAAEPDMKIDGVAAYVNAHTILASDIIKSSRELQQLLSQQVRSSDKLNSVYLDALNRDIERKLILDDYEGQKKIKIPESIFKERADAIIEDMFKGNRSDFLDALAADNVSESTWRNSMREKTIISAMRNLRVGSEVSISPLAAFEVYNNNRNEYTTEPSVKLRMIVIGKGASKAEKTVQKDKLKKLLNDLKNGADFAEEAKLYSEDSYASSGGMRNWMKRDMLRKDLAKVAFSTEVGEVRVVDIGKQYCLIKVEDRVEAEEVSFDDARPLIEKQLRSEQSKKLYDAWIARLRKTAYIKIEKKSPF